MAEMVGGGGGGHKKGSGPKTKKKSTRIDMTAMVDVAFLLLTFFVLTASMSNPNVMELTLPPKLQDDVVDKTADVQAEKVVTLILEKDNKITWFQGVCDKDSLKTTDYSAEGVRKVLMQHIKRKAWLPLCTDASVAKDQFGAPIDKKSCWSPMFVIKPRFNCQYKDVVNMLDELSIVDAKIYALTKFTADDSLQMIGEKPKGGK
jgi:hypothetical protein